MSATDAQSWLVIAAPLSAEGLKEVKRLRVVGHQHDSVRRVRAQIIQQSRKHEELASARDQGASVSATAICCKSTQTLTRRPPTRAQACRGRRGRRRRRPAAHEASQRTADFQEQRAGCAHRWKELLAVLEAVRRSLRRLRQHVIDQLRVVAQLLERCTNAAPKRLSAFANDRREQGCKGRTVDGWQHLRLLAVEHALRLLGLQEVLVDELLFAHHVNTHA